MNALGRAFTRVRMACKNLNAFDVDSRSDARVSTESKTTFNGPAGAIKLWLYHRTDLKITM